MKKVIEVWHQDSPGMKVWVIRGFFDRLLRPTDFAGTTEKTYSSDPRSAMLWLS